jgi:flavodoxin/ferredoxin
MKCIVIYYSQTGNTEKVARSIQKGIMKANGQCDLVKIRDVNPRRLYDYDLIGIGCPVLGFQESMNVTAFIKNMRFVGGKHVFPFDTHATRGEFFFPSIVPKLKRKGLVVVGYFDCYGSMGQNPTAGHPDEIDLQEAEVFGKEIVSTSQRISAGESDLIPGYPDYVEFNVKKYIKDRQAKEKAMGIPEDMAERKTGSIQFDRAKCKYPKCKICMLDCPMEGIDITVDPPILGNPCMHCMGCTRNCPTGALSLAGPRMGTGPKVDPEINKAMFEEFYLKPLAKAEAEGRFRRLIPVEKVMQSFGGPPPGGE